MAIGLTRSKNLSESNLNLKTALQKLYSPGIEDDIELFSLSSSVESICFSGLVNDAKIQIFRLSTERLKTISGDVIKRTKFHTRYLTFTDENQVFFTNYEVGVGNDTDVSSPRYSISGSIPSIEVVSTGGGFYFLDSNNGLANLEFFTGTWSASDTSTITVSLTDHGFVVGQGLRLRFDNSGGGTNAASGDYTVESVSTNGNQFTVINTSGSISGSGSVSIENYEIRLSNVPLRGKISGSETARANVTFVKQAFDYLPGTAALYSNTSFGTQRGSTATTTITLANHGLVTGNKVYIRVLSGTLWSGFVDSVTVTSDSTFTVVLPVSSANTSEDCEVCLVDELLRFTPSYINRFGVKSIEITNAGSGYVIPENMEVVESNVNDANLGSVIKIRKQRGIYFEGQPEIIRSRVFTYTVKNSTEDGFFLIDNETGKYLYVDQDTPSGGLNSNQKIEIRRFDGVNVRNLLQFKFAQSPVYLISHVGYVYQMGNSISGSINSTANTASSLKLTARLCIQNTKRPTPSTSSENILGYTYNSFEGQDLVMWQRVVLRDQDFILDPSDTTFGSGSITGDRLRTSVSGFVLGPLVPWSSNSSGVVTITLTGHPVKNGDEIVINNVSATSGVAFSDGTYTATYINSSSFSISTNISTAGSGTANLVTADPNFQIRVPGLFIKVGADYRRAFSTTDKPFFQEITTSGGSRAVANPPTSGSSRGALSAEGTLVDENPSSSDWYSYNTTISQLAQRINTNGKDGAFYFHRTNAPSVGNITVNKGGTPSIIYSVPLFTLA